MGDSESYPGSKSPLALAEAGAVSEEVRELSRLWHGFQPGWISAMVRFMRAYMRDYDPGEIEEIERDAQRFEELMNKYFGKAP